ncbi:MAG: cytochrome c biogenesis protein ResB [Rikenellaceae bacterium]|nr:cytochrome c biogenesis protein ResB [Rikenellaceae bacterium]
MSQLRHNPFLHCACLFGVGVLLQLLIGDLDNRFFAHPRGMILAFNYLYLLILAYIFEDKIPIFRQLRLGNTATAALSSMVIIIVLFGLIRQDGNTAGVVGVLGFTRMTSSWPFNLLLFYFLTTLGLATIHNWHHLRHQKVASLLAHSAVFIALTAAWFGSGDKVRVKITTWLDQPVYKGLTADGREYELPFAVTLQRFSMEEYPPKLYIYDIDNKRLSRDFLASEERVGIVDDWELRITQHLSEAGCMPNDSIYRTMRHVGTMPALYVVARNVASGRSVEGWVSCGSHLFLAASLDLDNNRQLVMPAPEPKYYLSQITVTDAENVSRRFDVAVNRPAKFGAWQIYQVGYDTSRGRWSTSSVLECVRDGWYPIVHTALWLILAAGVAMFITAGGRTFKKQSARKEAES